ncbi:MAG: glycosyltransferase family 2 protein [Deltaproteobacteria bacterium]|nr:glycosyltransferase family 2 protein [Deltaproteobacteria bacterium]
MPSSETLVLIPAFNEEPRLPEVLQQVRQVAPRLDVLVVNDGSTDATSAVARAAGARVCAHPFNLGYGVALQTGYKYALRAGYRFVVQLDADGQHDPAYVAALLQAVEGADVVLGSRFREPGSYRPPLLRRAGMILFARVASMLMGQRITDPTSGFRVLSRRALQFCASDSFPVDYPDADMLVAFHRAGLRVAEVPVRMHASAESGSMHGGLRPLYYVFKMGISIPLTMLRREHAALEP